MAPKKVRLPAYPDKGPIPGPEMVRRAGLKDALAQHEGVSAAGRVASRFFHNIGADAMSDVHSLDPRTKSGAINLMAMFAGGRGGEGAGRGLSESQMAEAALGQHLGHGAFRDYGTGGKNMMINDPLEHGGMLSGARDIGFRNSVSGIPEEVLNAIRKNMLNPANDTGLFSPSTELIRKPYPRVGVGPKAKRSFHN